MAVLDAVPVEKIRARARSMSLAATIGVAITALFYGLGWLAGRTGRLLWMAVAWPAAAIAEGAVAGFARRPDSGG